MDVIPQRDAGPSIGHRLLYGKVHVLYLGLL